MFVHAKVVELYLRGYIVEHAVDGAWKSIGHVEATDKFPYFSKESTYRAVHVMQRHRRVAVLVDASNELDAVLHAAIGSTEEELQREVETIEKVWTGHRRFLCWAGPAHVDRYDRIILVSRGVIED